MSRSQAGGEAKTVMGKEASHSSKPRWGDIWPFYDLDGVHVSRLCSVMITEWYCLFFVPYGPRMPFCAVMFSGVVHFRAKDHRASVSALLRVAGQL